MYSPFEVLARWKETAGCQEGLKQCSACRNSSLQRLELSQNELTAAATKDVGSMLETQARLTYLDMCAVPSPGADVAGVVSSPGADVAGVVSSPSADVAAASPVPAQMWQG